MTRGDVALLIRRFLGGETKDYEWDDFVALRYRDDHVIDGVRRYLCDIHDLFPANNPGNYCNESGMAELVRIAELLEADRPIVIDVRGVPRPAE